jgi:hypothetical protein
VSSCVLGGFILEHFKLMNASMNCVHLGLLLVHLFVRKLDMYSSAFNGQSSHLHLSTLK